MTIVCCVQKVNGEFDDLQCWEAPTAKSFDDALRVVWPQIVQDEDFVCGSQDVEGLIDQVIEDVVIQNGCNYFEIFHDDGFSSEFVIVYC